MKYIGIADVMIFLGLIGLTSCAYLVYPYSAPGVAGIILLCLGLALARAQAQSENVEKVDSDEPS